MIPINYLAVLVAAIVAFVLGSLWYGPLFGKAWMKTLGMNMDEMKAKAQSDPSMKSKMMRGYVIMAIGALLTAYVLAHALIFANAYMQTTGAGAGLFIAFMNWLGFVAPVLVAPVMWEGRPWKWWFITSGYYLVSLGLMSLVLTYWK
jgi:hypothetical protein